MTVGVDTQHGHEDFTLWPRTLTLKVRHRDTDQPLKGFVFKVLQPGGASVTGTTDATGAVVVTLPKPAPFKVFAEAPSEITSWVDAEGRTREAKGVTAFKAVIEKPAKPATGSVIEQFVNLSSAADGQDAQGHLVKFEVKGEDPAQAGDPVFVRVRFGRQSRRNSPLPAVTGLTDMFVEADGFMVTGRVTLDANKKASFSVELGIAGGDTCDVAVGGTRAARDETRSLKNWRKVFYQVTRPASMTTPSLALMTLSLAKVFIRYEKYKEVTFAEGDSGTPAGSWFDGADFGLTGRAVNIGDHNKAFFHAKFDDSKNPIGVHVLFCHAQFDGGSPAHKTTWTTTIAPGTAKVAFPGGGSVYGLRKTLSGHVFPKAFQDGNDSVRNVTWDSLAASGPMAGKTGAITAADVHVNWNTAPPGDHPAPGRRAGGHRRGALGAGHGHGAVEQRGVPRRGRRHPRQLAAHSQQRQRRGHADQRGDGPRAGAHAVHGAEGHAPGHRRGRPRVHVRAARAPGAALRLRGLARGVRVGGWTSTARAAPA